MASWKVMRRDSCASSPQSPPWKRLCWMSSRIANSEQHAAFVAVLIPSGHATRRVSAPVATVHISCQKTRCEWRGREKAAAPFATWMAPARVTRERRDLKVMVPWGCAEGRGELVCSEEVERGQHTFYTPQDAAPSLSKPRARRKNRLDEDRAFHLCRHRQANRDA